MAMLAVALYVALAVLLIDSAVELALISSTVSWLHRTATGTLAIAAANAEFLLAWKPERLLVDPGHASNGAAGSALVGVCLCGIPALLLPGRVGQLVHRSWVGFSLLAMALTTGALAYVFAEAGRHDGQKIDVRVAAAAAGSKYPLGEWTPQGWFAAVLDLRIVDDGLRGEIEHGLRLMKGWRDNLIPMFVVQLATTGLAVAHTVQRSRNMTFSKG